MATSKENANGGGGGGNGGNGEELKFSIGETVNGFKLVKKIDEGGFGQVFKVTKDDKTFYAMKLESSFQEGGSAIKLEINVLKGLPPDTVFPSYVAVGRKPKFHYLVLELLGDNLKTLKSKSPNPDMWTDGTWSRVGIQCFYAIKKMHEAGFVHRDIKPNNFAIGMNTLSELRSRRIFLFDFGLARKFIQKLPASSKKNSKSAPKKNSGPPKLKSSPSRTSAPSKVKRAPSRMSHPAVKPSAPGTVPPVAQVPPPGQKKLVGPKKIMARESRECASISMEERPEEEEYAFRLPRARTEFRGTPQYASPNAHLLKELGRHDDIWSLMYMISEFFNELPWTTNDEIPIEEMKDQSTLLRLFHDDKFPDRLTSGMRHQLEEIDKNMKEMNYYSFPNYELVYKFLKDSMDKAKVVWDTPFDWELGPQSPIDTTQKNRLLKKKNFEWENPKDFFVQNRWGKLKVPTMSPSVSTKQPVPSTAPKTKLGKNQKSDFTRNGNLSREDSAADTDDDKKAQSTQKSLKKEASVMDNKKAPISARTSLKEEVTAVEKNASTMKSVMKDPDVVESKKSNKAPK